MLSPELLTTITERGVSEIISRDEFVRLLRSGRPLRLKMGFDPSRPDIHLGHVVGLRKLRQLQDLGHQVILIVGDWTAQIGDPSGQSVTRPMLTHEQVMENAQSYLRQFFKVVDEDKTRVVQQSEWFGKFTLADVINLTGKFTVAQFLQRADFAQRFADKRPIALTELLYPLLQAYDSVAIEADVEFGGTDQRFNNLLGRELQAQMGQRPQQVFLVPLLVGTDGTQKMSKSLGNYIGIDEPPGEMFGKTMSVPDALLPTYFELLTDEPMGDLTPAAIEAGLVNPMDWKKRLGVELVTQFHGKEAAVGAQAEFERVVQRRERPKDMPTLSVPFSASYTALNTDLVAGEGTGGAEIHIVRVLVRAGLAPSNGEARRLLQQGAVRVDERKLDPDEMVVAVKPGTVIQVGNRRFVQLVDGG